MTVYIKNMVSMRCKIAVKAAIKKLGLHYSAIELGSAELIEDINLSLREQLRTSLKHCGLELLEDKKIILIERIKGLIVDLIHYTEDVPKTNYSVYIAEHMHYDYTYLANIFSEVKGITIEHYIIAQKIERVKELLEEGELNLTEISYKMHYSSVAHLSNQFKKVTGLTPSAYRSRLKNGRVCLDML